MSRPLNEKSSLLSSVNQVDNDPEAGMGSRGAAAPAPASSGNGFGKFCCGVFLGFLLAAGLIAIVFGTMRDNKEQRHVPFIMMDHPMPPSSRWGSVVRPFPTGAFWTNFVLKDGDGQVGVYPYAVKAQNIGLQVSYSAYRRKITPVNIVDYFADDWTMSTAEPILDRYISEYDELSVSMVFIAKNGHYKAILPKGSPYITIEYNSMTPTLVTNWRIVEVNGIPAKVSTDTTADADASASTGATAEGDGTASSTTDAEAGASTSTSTGTTTAGDADDDDNSKVENINPIAQIGRAITETTANTVTVSSRTFKIRLSNGQVWMLYTGVSSPITLSFSDTTLSFTSIHQGALRLAYAPDERTEAKLTTYADAYPVGGAFDYYVQKGFGLSRGNSDQARMTYSWKVKSLTESSLDPLTSATTKHTHGGRGGGGGSSGGGRHGSEGVDSGAGGGGENDNGELSSKLLMLALPHHVTMFPPKSDPLANELAAEMDGKYICMKGKMTGVLGSKWTMDIPLTGIQWRSPSGIHDQDHVTSLISDALEVDLPSYGVPSFAADPYNFGKEIGKLARLALITDEIGDTENHAVAITRLRQGLLPWMTGSNPDHLCYDRVWGGVTPIIGLMDQMADYGSGMYNDHHFHYGYFLYAAAVLAKFDPEWYASYSAQLDWLRRDIAGRGRWESGGKDEYLPFARHKDFYDGHSWASGLFPMNNGKSQESTAEAVNAYYGAYLLGLAADRREIADWGRVLLALEIRTAQTYWQMGGEFGVNIYDPVFARNKMAGVVGALDVTATTWFGGRYEYVHGIQMMPFTPITEELLPIPYVKEEYPVLLQALTMESVGKSTTPGQDQEDQEENSGGEGIECDNCGSDGSSSTESPTPVDYSGKVDLGTNDQQWEAIAYLDMAILFRDQAMQNVVEKIQDFGSGNTLTNSLYWIATRPTLTGPYNMTKYLQAAKKPVESYVAPTCRANTACFAQRLSDGDCCAGDGTGAPDGAYLSCCPEITGFYGTVGRVVGDTYGGAAAADEDHVQYSKEDLTRGAKVYDDKENAKYQQQKKKDGNSAGSSSSSSTSSSSSSSSSTSSDGIATGTGSGTDTSASTSASATDGSN